MNSLQFKRSAFATILVSPTLVTLFSCGGPPILPVRPNVVPVTTALVVTKTVPLNHMYPGLAVSPRMIKIDARVEGFLLKQGAPDGSVTKPDQVIYRIDPRPFEATLASQQGALVQAIAQRDYSRKEMERNAPLVKTDAISQQDFDKLVATYETDQGQFLTAEANVLTAKINLSYCTIVSPFVGILGASQFFEGAVVGTSNTTNLNSLVQIDPMWADFSPSATEWPKFSALIAKNPLEVTVTFDGNDNIKATGKIIFSDNQVSTSTGTLMMRVEFPNPNLIFRPGVYVKVNVSLGEQPNVMVVPQDCVFARETNLYVWRIKADDTVETVQVKLQKKENGIIQLLSGPQVGDRLVVDGIQRLKPGSKIVDMSQPPKPAAPTDATPAPTDATPAPTDATPAAPAATAPAATAPAKK
ncbi:MAG: efflux RND transporter periplasmic adaptor subunit [Phycisphaerales bacterium]|nr:efflux RND transporter periplasmic adaptor subunit [Phycisphaerales bacterium]